MRPPKPFPPGTSERMKVLLRQAKTSSDTRRIQAVLMRAAHNSTPQQIAEATGLTLNTVRILHSQFLRHGEAILVGRPGRGGARHRLLAPKEEQALLARFADKAKAGGVLEVSAIHAAYEKAIGKPVGKSTVYRLLERHGWRKIAPRASHPKRDESLAEPFKKASRKSSPKNGRSTGKTKSS